MFEKVLKNGPWIELIHTGGEMAPGRYADLRRTHANSLTDLRLTAIERSSMRLFVDRKKWPEASAINLSALFNSQYPNCLETPFGDVRKTIDPKTDEVKFSDLPPGEYQVTVQGKPERTGGGGFRVDTIGSYTVKIPEGEELEGEL